MPHKDKKEHAAYTKRYLQQKDQHDKNLLRVRLNYWRHKIEDYYARHKITDDIYKVREKTLDELKQICYDLGISERGGKA